MVAAMARTAGPVHALIVWADSPTADRTVLPPGWPGLARFASVGDLVRCAWSDRAVAGEVIAAFMGPPDPDGVAVQAALAILAPRLAAVVGRWARAGVPPVDLEDMEGELVAETLFELRRGSGVRPPGLVVDRAWDRVRKQRRRDRTRQSGHVRLADQIAAPGPDPAAVPAAVMAAGVVVDAYRQGWLSLPAAQALWATGVAGFSCADAAPLLGCAHGALRARRSRAIRALAA
jgi:hypothetical protein